MRYLFWRYKIKIIDNFSSIFINIWGYVRISLKKQFFNFETSCSFANFQRTKIQLVLFYSKLYTIWRDVLNFLSRNSIFTRTSKTITNQIGPRLLQWLIFLDIKQSLPQENYSKSVTLYMYSKLDYNSNTYFVTLTLMIYSKNPRAD